MHSIPDEDPGDPRAFIPNIEFYITNVCNLTCSNCNRFNNHDFAGWQRWSDYNAQYELWAQHVRLQRITILGGEPLLNPTLLDWVDGINQLWGKTVQVLTNGTRLNQFPNLYDRLITFTDPRYPWVHNWLGVSLHNENDREHCFAEIRRFLRGTIDYYSRAQDPDKTNGAHHAFVDSNGMRICVWEYDEFYGAAVQPTTSGRYVLHNNDPEQAHRACGFAMYKCYHFIKAKLYKCGPVALFPEFDQQHQFDISAEDRKLMYSYLALAPEEFESRGLDFLAHIDDPIPQCKFCPVNHGHKKIYAVSKKANSVSGFK
jgi:organic radical activating enzyme